MPWPRHLKGPSLLCLSKYNAVEGFGLRYRIVREVEDFIDSASWHTALSMGIKKSKKCQNLPKGIKRRRLKVAVDVITDDDCVSQKLEVRNENSLVSLAQGSGRSATPPRPGCSACNVRAAKIRCRYGRCSG